MLRQRVVGNLWNMYVLLHCFAQVRSVEMCVYLGCEYIFVAQKFLHLAYVGSPLKQVCCKGVTECVRANLLINAGAYGGLFE